METVLNAVFEDILDDPALLEQVDTYTLIEAKKIIDYYLDRSTSLDYEEEEEGDM